MAKKKKDKVTVKFISNSAVDVTGSAVLISYENNDYLIEFGQQQGMSNLEKEYALNLQTSKNLNIDNLKCVLISHQNIDHISLIPSLYKRGYNGDVFGSYEALAFSEKLLEDCAFIIDRNVQSFHKKGRKIEHIYKSEDVVACTNHMISRDLNRVYKFDEYMSYEFVPTNHLTGSCQVVVYIKKKNGNVVKIHYTGDLGSELGKHFGSYLKDTEVVTTSNLVISECTYFGNVEADYTKQDGIEERKDIKTQIWNTLHSNGKVVIPCFSMQRSQSLMLEIWKAFKEEKFDFDVIVDSRLTKRINGVFKKVLEGDQLKEWEECLAWRNFKFIETYPETKALISTRKPCVVITSGGMVQAGHSVDWVASSIDCSRDMIMVVGYVPNGSILDKLLKGQKTVKWEGKTYLVRCKIKKYNTFSSHLSAKGILKYMKQVNTGLIVYHHGSKEAKENAVKLTKEELINIGKTTNVMASYKNMVIYL